MVVGVVSSAGGVDSNVSYIGMWKTSGKRERDVNCETVMV